MNKIKAYYGPNGYQLYMPDGTPLPFLRQISVHDNWAEATTRCGGPEMIHEQTTADANFYVEVVNEPPPPPMVIDPSKAYALKPKMEAYRELLPGSVDGYVVVRANEVLQDLKNKGMPIGEISDGYHTFDELYEHRIANFRIVCKHIKGAYDYRVIPVWKSLFHSDGSSYDEWFIAGIHTEAGKQITYHIPMKEWSNWPGEEREQAPEWDGHTSADVLKRLAEL